MGKYFFQKLLFSAMILLGLHTHVQAQFEEGKETRPEVHLLGSSIIAGAKDSILFSQQGEDSQKIKNIITFKIDEESGTFFKSKFTAIIYLKIDMQSTLGSPTQTLYKSLTVNYDTVTGSKYAVRAYLQLDRAEKVKITVDTISVTGQSGWAPVNVLQLYNEMWITRYYTLSNNASVLSPSFNPAIDDTDAVHVSWIWNTGVNNNMSQVEWAWVGDENIGYYMQNGAVNFDNLFFNNSTRVDLDYLQDHFNIPLLYDGKGKVYYRVRAAYRKNSGNVITGPWSAPDSFSFNGHETSLNWQSATSFAENGKLKSVIQYFDGSLRNRQTVTKDNSTGNTIVGETIYDLQGRPNLQILPSPTSDNNIKFFNGFNRFQGQSVTDDPAKYFDLTPSAVKCNRVMALDSNYGNGKYYSANNPWLGIESMSNYIPDAQGYAFTETRFMDDATQRIKSQGGVGINFQINSGHETKYYYGKPSQQEMDALFGTEVGEAAHYFKNMVQDANGQMSVSYTDMHGRTIATALAGDAPSNLVSINTSTTDYPKTDSLTNQLLTPTTNLIRDHSIENVNSILVPANTIYHFTYMLDPGILQQLNCNNQQICFDCKYDLEISIKSDECGNDIPKIRKYNNLQIVPANQSCGTSMGFAGTGVNTATKQIDFYDTLQTGSYVIRKTLTINDSLFTIRKDSALKAFLCKSQQSIYDSVYNILMGASDCGNPSGSTRSCDSCIAHLGTFASYKLKYLVDIGDPDNTTLDSKIHVQYSKDSTECATSCGSMNNQLGTLQTIRKQMLTDMIPFTGQYAIDSVKNENGDLDFTRVESKYNIFTTIPYGPNKPYFRHPSYEYTNQPYYFTDEQIIDSTIKYTVPTDGSVWLGTISQETFTDIFEPSCANSLIKYHPEYSKLLYAENNLKTSYDWLDSLQACESYEHAHLMHYDDPVNYDPYFSRADASNDKATMQGYIRDHISGDGSPSIWQIANGNMLCATKQDFEKAACINSQESLDIASGATAKEKDKIWQNFKGIYLSYRNEMVTAYINTHVTDPSPSDMASLISEGKKLLFPTTQQMSDQYGYGSWWDIAASSDTNGLATALGGYLDSNTVDNCSEQRPFWKARLMQCEQLMALLNNSNSADTLIVNTIINTILDSMVMVCQQSSDSQYPFGASTAESSFSGTPQSFEAIVDHVFQQYGIHTTPGNNYFCNPYSVDFPKPYGKNPPTMVKNTNMIDTCGCKQFENLKIEAKSLNYDTLSFSDMNRFLLAQYHDTLTQILWDGLQKCGHFFVDTCHYVRDTAEESYVSYRQADDESDCIIPQIYYINTSNAQTDNVEIYYNTNSSYSNCYLLVYNSSGSQIGTYVITEGNSYFLLTLPRCHSYSFVVEAYSHQCGDQFSDTSIAFVGSGCPVCPKPVIYSASVLLPNPSGGNENVALHYSLPTGSSSCVVKVISIFNNSPVINSIEAIDSASLGDTLLLPACKKYRFVIECNLSPADSLCDSIAVSDTLRLDSCYHLVCETLYTPILLSDFVVMPPFLSCGYIKPCITCGKLDSLVQEFRTIYPTYNGAPYLDSTISDTLAKQNSLLARFLNYRTGFSLNAITYLTAYIQCHSGALPGDNAICSFTKPLNDPSEIYHIDTMPCKNVQTQAEYISQLLYQQMKDSLIDTFDSLYIAKCLDAKYLEKFYATYHPSEYHYTLYYYDQAGNLVKTLPPAGVKPNYNATYLTNVVSSRNAGTDQFNSNNKDSLATNYRYNTLNQVIAQKTPDAGISKFWYDRLGRLAVSQNAHQVTQARYSYTLYDVLGRIIEVGEKPKTGSAPVMSQAISQSVQQLDAWINTTATAEFKKQITRTIYDTAYTPLNTSLNGFTGLYQQNLRNRVSYTYIKATDSTDTNYIWDAATFYSYDIHGNVDTLLQDYKTGMGALQCLNAPGNPSGNRFKKIVYDYDLISGKVNVVAYQPGQADQFYHQYAYDAENRLITVNTSKDKIYWEKDASYTYFRHRPLARVVLGQNLVQGVDYAYTLQGWLKGVNSTTLSDGTYDMGQDGKAAGPNSLVARDAYGYALHYFDVSAPKDYIPIATVQPFANAAAAGSGFTSLYNGNIGAMSVNISKFTDPLLYTYKYDQLNRLSAMLTFKGLTAANNWSITAIQDYRENVSYDPNGNILTYKRNGTTTNLPAGVTGGIGMDSLTYSYISGTNKLKRVADNAAYTSRYPDDIDNQADSVNYVYDEIGNLVQDKAEGINSISWTVYGKISRIVKSNGTIISYTYDAAGNRISKDVSGRATYYVRDATGNILSIYEKKDTLKQTEIDLYGSSRLGSYKVSTDVQNCAIATSDITTFTRGNKFFELSNHLGNVLMTVSDKKIQVSANTTTIDYYKADILTANDYYPFGMMMPGRKYYCDTTTEAIGTNGGGDTTTPATTIIYKHSFEDTPYTHPYTVTPNIHTNLSQSSWSNSRNPATWTTYPGIANAGKALGISTSTPDSTSITLTMKVDSGYKMTVKSFSFYDRSSSTGYRNWSMKINNIAVGADTIYKDVLNGTNPVRTIGTIAVSNLVSNLTGNITLVLTIKNKNSGTGTYRFDDFTLNGYVIPINNSGSSTNQYVYKGAYRYGFNGKENDNEVKGEGNQQDYNRRVYDPRLGRFLSTDPLTNQFPYYTPYQYAGNKPIWAIDLDGAEEFLYFGYLNNDHPYVKQITKYTTMQRSWLGGLWTTTTQIPERFEVHLDNGNKYFIGFAGPEGAANQGMVSLARDLLTAKNFNAGFFESIFYTDEESIALHNGVKNDFKDRLLQYLVSNISTGLVLKEGEAARLLGSKGPQSGKSELWKDKNSKARIDVENPTPGKRAGSLHYQDENNARYQYNVNDKKFYQEGATKNVYDVEAPKSVNKLLENKNVQKAIDKGLVKYLGEDAAYGNKFN